MKVEISKGVLGKNGAPFASETLHFVQNGYLTPVPYNMRNLGLCLARLADKQIQSIKLIDDDNNYFVITN